MLYVVLLLYAPSMTLKSSPLPQHRKQVIIIDPQPWDVECKSKHHPECVVLLSTLGNVPAVIPQYYCRGRRHDNATVFYWYW